jgi:hypothetical protein
MHSGKGKKTVEAEIDEADEIEEIEETSRTCIKLRIRCGVTLGGK